MIAGVFAKPEGGILTFSALFMLWMASNGVEALRVVLNRAYRTRESRSLWHRRLQSVLFILLGSLAALLLSFGVVLGPLLWQMVTRFVTASASERVLWEVSRYSAAALVTGAALLSLHRWLPNTRRSFRQLLPGVTVTAALLLAAAILFSLYLQSVADYNLVYGSLASVVVILVYLYVNALAFVFGAEINSAINSG